MTTQPGCLALPGPHGPRREAPRPPAPSPLAQSHSRVGPRAVRRQRAGCPEAQPWRKVKALQVQHMHNLLTCTPNPQLLWALTHRARPAPRPAGRGLGPFPLSPLPAQHCHSSATSCPAPHPLTPPTPPIHTHTSPIHTHTPPIHPPTPPIHPPTHHLYTPLPPTTRTSHYRPSRTA